VTLFRPGLAFKTKGNVSPHYIVDVNMKAMMDADLVLFFLNDSKTVGTWMEAIWALNAKKDIVLYAEPSVRQSVYMRWLANMLHTKWITNIQELAVVLKSKIKQINAENFIELTEEFTLGDILNFQEGVVE
jgi:nucleoside 2-deoxyribosyltransferase